MLDLPTQNCILLSLLQENPDAEIRHFWARLKKIERTKKEAENEEWNKLSPADRKWIEFKRKYQKKAI